MRIRTADGDVDELLGEVEQLAVTPGVDEATVVAALERVASAAEDGTETWCMAHREMARRVLPENPWRSAVLARAVLARDPEDHLAWGILGLAHSLLDNRALSVRAYRRALALAPGNVAYLHNLGHLLDALEDRPTEALPLLRRAHELARSDTDIAASFAHALARTGRLAEAIAVLKPRLRVRATREDHELYAWLVELADDAAAKAKPPAASTRERRVRASRRSRV